MMKREMTLDDMFSACPYEDDFESMVTKQGILEVRSGWTEKAIHKFLGSPCLLKKKAGFKHPMNLYHVECVLDAEADPDFQEYVLVNKERQEQLEQARDFRKRYKSCQGFVTSALFEQKAIVRRHHGVAVSAYICDLLINFALDRQETMEISHEEISQSFKISAHLSKRYFTDYGLRGFFEKKKENGKNTFSLGRLGHQALQYFHPSFRLSDAEMDQAYQEKLEVMREKFEAAELARSSHSERSAAEVPRALWEELVAESQSAVRH